MPLTALDARRGGWGGVFSGLGQAPQSDGLPAGAPSGYPGSTLPSQNEARFKNTHEIWVFKSGRDAKTGQARPTPFRRIRGGSPIPPECRFPVCGGM